MRGGREREEEGAGVDGMKSCLNRGGTGGQGGVDRELEGVLYTEENGRHEDLSDVCAREGKSECVRMRGDRRWCVF
jgi:hypothetical protein